MSVADAGVRPPAERTRAPWHLWLVGILALLWTAWGAFGYLATQMRLDFAMSGLNEEQVAYFNGFPAWATAAWAIGVWSAFLGSVTLLLRKRWAVWLYALSLVGLVGSTVYIFAASEGVAVMGTGVIGLYAVIWIVAIALLLYARAQAKKGVLR